MKFKEVKTRVGGIFGMVSLSEFVLKVVMILSDSLKSIFSFVNSKAQNLNLSFNHVFYAKKYIICDI